MSCVNYYIDDTLYGFYLFLLGILVGLVIILLIWFCIRYIFRNNKVSDKSFFVAKLSIKKNRKLLLKRLNTVNSLEENVEGYQFIFRNNFDKWKNINRNYVNLIEHIDISDLFRLNESLIREDIIGYGDLEFHYRNERITGHKYLHQQLINMMLKEKLLSQDEHKLYCQNLEKRYEAQIDLFNNECDTFLTELRNNAPKNAMESEIQGIIADQFPQKADFLMNNIINDQSTEIREMILKTQINMKLSDDDVSVIMSMYLSSKRKLDECIKNNQASMNERLAARLANLKSKFNEEIITHDIKIIEDEVRVKNVLNSIQDNLPDLSEAERNKIINDHKRNIEKIKSENESNLEAQRLALKLKIEEARKKDLEKVFSVYEKDLIKYGQQVEKVTLSDSDNSLNKYEQLKTLIDENVNKTIETWDEKLISQFKQITDSYTQSMDEEINDAELRLLQQVYHEHGIDDYDINAILKKHEQNNKNLKNNMNRERQRQIDKMNDIIAKRQNKNDLDLSNGIRNQYEQEDKQRQILNSAMNDQMELPPDIKNKIIEDSLSNEVNNRNQLCALRIRQQKQLELKLATKMCENANSQKAAKDVSNIPEVDLFEEEEQKVAVDKERLILEMRDKLAKETKEMLSSYEDQICKIMAMYQVNHAKDLQKKKNLQNIYDNLCNALSRPALEQNRLAAEQVIDQFTNDKNNLESVKKKAQQDQKKLMDIKLEQKIAKIKSQTQSELKQQYTDQLLALKESGVSDAALAIANEHMVDKIDAETESAVKMERSKESDEFEKSKDRYERSIDSDLLDKKKDIISRLMLITDMKISQISDLIDQISPNIDDETKKSIINEIKRKSNQNVKEKTQYNFQKSETPVGDNDNADNVNNVEQDVPLKAKRKKKKRMKNREERVETEELDNSF